MQIGQAGLVAAAFQHPRQPRSRQSTLPPEPQPVKVGLLVLVLVVLVAVAHRGRLAIG
jgi:hypothetical protein